MTMPDLPRDRATYWHVATSLGDVQLLSAHYVRQNYARHTHQGYGVGVIEKGAMAFDYMGERMLAASGKVNLVVPGEPHDGHAATEQGWVYRMFYVDPQLLSQVVSDVADHPHDLPFFPSGVIHDPALALQLRTTHRQFEQEGQCSLELESRLLDILALWVRRHSDDPPLPRSPHAAQDAVDRVRDYISAEYARQLKLDEIAAVAQLSAYHMLRVFKQSTGLPPHLYLSQTRVEHAQALIREGQALSAVAQNVGLSDQSHLNRQFKRILGITPGQYRKIVQD